MASLSAGFAAAGSKGFEAAVACGAKVLTSRGARGEVILVLMMELVILPWCEGGKSGLRQEEERKEGRWMVRSAEVFDWKKVRSRADRVEVEKQKDGEMGRIKSKLL